MTRAERDTLIRALGQKTSKIAEMRYRAYRGESGSGDAAEIAKTEMEIHAIASILYPVPEGVNMQ